MQEFSPSRRQLGMAALAGLAATALPRKATAAAIIPSTTGVCATCAFWQGPRMPSMDRRSVIVADGAKGLCKNPDSPFGGVFTQPQQASPTWRRVPGLT